MHSENQSLSHRRLRNFRAQPYLFYKNCSLGYAKSGSVIKSQLILYPLKAQLLTRHHQLKSKLKEKYGILRHLLEHLCQSKLERHLLPSPFAYVFRGPLYILPIYITYLLNIKRSQRISDSSPDLIRLNVTAVHFTSWKHSIHSAKLTVSKLDNIVIENGFQSGVNVRLRKELNTILLKCNEIHVKQLL